ncbi:MAG TPA: CopD family protein, partial [Devosia sp.]
SGHASAAAPQWLTRPAVFLHLAGILFWVGALLPLGQLLRERSAVADHALAAFSRWIPFAIVPLVLSGAILSVVQLGWPGPHWVSPYGFILAAKLGLLVALFALALANRRWLTAPALAGNTAGRARLRRSIGAEMVLVLLVLGLVAGWRFTPPPRALAAAAAAAAEPRSVHLMDAEIMATVTVTPGRAGPVTAGIEITDSDGVPRDAQSVTLILAAPDLGIEPLRREAMARNGEFHVEGLTIPIPGRWQIEVDVRLSRFELHRLASEIAIRQ